MPAEYRGTAGSIILISLELYLVTIYISVLTCHSTVGGALR